MPNVMTNQVRGGTIVPVPTLRGSASMTSPGAGMTVTAPASSSLCVVVVRDEAGGSEAPSSVTWGAVGMTQFAIIQGGGASLYFYGATGCTATTVTANYPTYSADLDLVAIELTGTPTASYTDVTKSAASVTTTVATGAFSTVQDGAMVLVAESAPRVINATPTGYTQLVSLGGTFKTYVGYKVVTPPGSENPSVTLASAYVSGAVILAAGIKHA